MHFIAIQPEQCEAFQKAMNEAGWPVIHQDVGQTELLAYGYVIIWQKGGSDKVILNYSDRQGQAQAQLEASSGAKETVQQILSEL